MPLSRNQILVECRSEHHITRESSEQSRDAARSSKLFKNTWPEWTPVQVITATHIRKCGQIHRPGPPDILPLGNAKPSDNLPKNRAVKDMLSSHASHVEELQSITDLKELYKLGKFAFVCAQEYGAQHKSATVGGCLLVCMDTVESNRLMKESVSEIDRLRITCILYEPVRDLGVLLHEQKHSRVIQKEPEVREAMYSRSRGYVNAPARFADEEKPVRINVRASDVLVWNFKLLPDETIPQEVHQALCEVLPVPRRYDHTPTAELVVPEGSVPVVSGTPESDAPPAAPAQGISRSHEETGPGPGSDRKRRKAAGPSEPAEAAANTAERGSKRQRARNTADCAPSPAPKSLTAPNPAAKRVAPAAERPAEIIEWVGCTRCSRAFAFPGVGNPERALHTPPEGTLDRNQILQPSREFTCADASWQSCKTFRNPRQCDWNTKSAGQFGGRYLDVPNGYKLCGISEVISSRLPPGLRFGSDVVISVGGEVCNGVYSYCAKKSNDREPSFFAIRVCSQDSESWRAHAHAVSIQRTCAAMYVRNSHCFVSAVPVCIMIV